MSSLPLHRRCSFLFPLLLLAAGCGTLKLQPRAAAPPQGKVITGAQIEQTGARTAWEVLRRSHVHLSFFDGSTGEGRHLAQRGTYHQAPLVVIDGIPTVDGYGMLGATPAEVIHSIRVLSGRQAMPHYGTAAGAGAILIETRKGPERR